MQVAITGKVEEYAVDGSIYTYDHDARAGYVNVAPAPTGSVLGRTVDLGGGVMVDLDRDDKVVGVECCTGPIEPWVLMRVVRWLNER